MSASSMRVSTCICVRSFAITNSLGACRLAATVCPRSIEREMTTPSIGRADGRVALVHAHRRELRPRLLEVGLALLARATSAASRSACET